MNARARASPSWIDGRRRPTREHYAITDNMRLATLLIHAEKQGYWSKLGEQLEEDMESLLGRHLLAGLVNAPWVRTDDAESADDTEFLSALQELVAYACEESVRVKKKSGILFSRRHGIPATSSRGILDEMQSLFKKYRTEVVRQSRLQDEEGRR